MLLLFSGHLAPRSQFLFSILEDAFAQSGNAIIYVFQSENISRSARQSIHLCTSILESSHELLNVSALIDCVQVALLIDFIVECHGKLLKWMYKCINFFRLVLQTIGQSKRLCI